MPDSMKAQERRDDLDESAENIPGKEWRCPYCHKLLMKGELGSTSAVSIKCTRRICRRIVTFNVL